jgi:hypothetical protein
MSIQGKDIVNGFKSYPVPATCFIIVLVALLSFYFRADLLSETADKLEGRNKELKKLKANIAASVQIDDQLAVLTKANEKFMATAMRVSELAKNPQYFYNLESQTGVTLADVKQIVTSAPAKLAPDSYFVIPFSVTAEGEFKQLIKFMRTLEYSDNVSRVASVAMSPTQGTRVSMSVNMEVLGLR